MVAGRTKLSLGLGVTIVYHYFGGKTQDLGGEGKEEGGRGKWEMVGSRCLEVWMGA